jgi:hypothetical protein
VRRIVERNEIGLQPLRRHVETQVAAFRAIEQQQRRIFALPLVEGVLRRRGIIMEIAAAIFFASYVLVFVEALDARKPPRNRSSSAPG